MSLLGASKSDARPARATKIIVRDELKASRFISTRLFQKHKGVSMNIKFRNESDKNIILTLNGIVHFSKPHSEDILQSNNEIHLSLTTEDDYSYETASEKRGLTLFHRFITIADYNFTLDKDSEISLTVESARGNNFDSYQRVIPTLNGRHLPSARYSVKNESSVRQKLKYDEEKLDKTSTVINIGMKLDNIIATVCGVFLVLVLLIIAIFYFKEYPKTTAIILSILFVVGAVGYKILKKFINFITKIFEKFLDRHGDKIGDAIAPCTDMPMELFEDVNSYFDTEYISAVFRYSTKRK